MKPSAKLLAIALLLVGLVFVNFFASQLPFRADTTAENIYTLSPGTKSLLSKIEEPVVRARTSQPSPTKTTPPAWRKCCANTPARPEANSS